MSWLQIHVCNPCGLQAPSFKFAFSLISAKWRFFFSLFPSLGDTGSERERKEVIVFNESLPFLFFTAASHSVPPPTHKRSNSYNYQRFHVSQSAVGGKEGQLLIIKRHLFWSCGVLNSSYTWHFFAILATL